MLLRREFYGMVIKTDEADALGKGGEAEVYGVVGEPGLAAKIYCDAKARQERARKLAVMCARPLNLPTTADGHTPVAWPIDLLSEPGTWTAGGEFMGFLMPRVHEARGVIDYYNPLTRLEVCPLFDYRYLLRTARNLAAAVRALHTRDYIIGDLKHSNILVTETALVTLVDADSFQVRDPETGTVYACPVHTPDFTAPELQGVDPGSVVLNPEQDNFALAVLIFHLLMEGTHPFAGVYLGEDDPPPFEERIRNGHYPYGANPGPYKPATRSAPPITLLPPEIRELFRRCFEDGYTIPTTRPDAKAWQTALDEAKRHLIACDANPQHWYGDHLDRCPWCARRDTQLRGIDPFPSEIEIREWGIWQPGTMPAMPFPVSPLPSSLPVGGKPSSAPVQTAFGLAVTPHTPPAPSTPEPNMGAGVGAMLAGVFGLFLLVFVGALSHTSKRHDYPRTTCTMNGVEVPCPTSPDAEDGTFLPGITGATRHGTSDTRIDAPEALMNYAPDGKSLLFSQSGNASIWDTTSGKLFQRAGSSRLPSSEAVVMAALSSSRILENVSSKQRLQVYSLTEHEPVTMLPLDAFNAQITCWACAPEKHMAALGMSTGEIENEDRALIRIWNWDTNAVSVLLAPGQSIDRVCFSPDGSAIAGAVTTGGATTFYIWRVNTGDLVRSITVNSEIKAFALTNYDLLLTSQGADVTVWNYQTGERRKTLHGNQTPIWQLALSAQSDLLAGLDVSGNIEVWNLRNDQQKYILRSKELFTALAFAPEGDTLAAGDTQGKIEIWNVRTGKRVKTLSSAGTVKKP